jgi:hypothetical protein
MEGMFIDRFGSNFRNKLAHGLLYSDAFYTDEAAYIWWSILRLCCYPLINTQSHSAKGQESAG